jgi:hypothetical protein
MRWEKYFPGVGVSPTFYNEVCVMKPFSITRFYENRPVDEKASAGTAH